jgi:hypothetical protein
MNSPTRTQPMTATHTPWEAQAYDESESGIAIIGLRTNEDGTSYPSPTNGIVAWVTLHPTEINAKDPTRALATAALIVNAVNSNATLKARIQELEEQAIVLQARGDLAVENRNYWQAEAERLAAPQPKDGAK